MELEEVNLEGVVSTDLDLAQVTSLPRAEEGLGEVCP
jgi:hypothetical protein